jgi:hypothetical protein
MFANSRKPSKHVAMSPVLVLTWDVLMEVIRSIGGRRAETGGALGGKEDGAEVDRYHFDESSRNSAVTYTPDHRFLNGLFKKHWNPEGVRLRGFVHSHPGRSSQPSHGDEVYAKRILDAIDDLGVLWLPIVNTVPDTGEFRLTPWLARRDAHGLHVVRGRVKVVDVPSESRPDVIGEVAVDSLRPDDVVEEIVLAGQSRRAPAPVVAIDSLRAEEGGPPDRETVTRDEPRVDETRDDGVARPEATQVNTTSSPPITREEREEHDRTRQEPPSADRSAAEDGQSGRKSSFGTAFDRVKDAYDLDVMRDSRIIAVGAGGAASWLEELARAGLGQFVLIDGDVVSETNLATQQTYRRDIGRPKVDCIAERVRDINPSAKIIAIQKNLDVFVDEPVVLNDEMVGQLAFAEIDGRKPARTVIAGLTDNFFAQARTNRIALKLGLPSLCAQVYREGRGAEVTFTYPGVTPACHRCILSSRYHHFLEERRENDVTSHGTPIFSTTRLNAIKGAVMLALLHHESTHSRWGTMLSRIGKRNLIQVRMDPDLFQTVGMTVFDRVFQKADQARIFFDEAVWLPQDQECVATGYAVPCPDCGGTGDLRNAVGKTGDTRLARPASGDGADAANPNASVRRALDAYRTNGGTP